MNKINDKNLTAQVSIDIIKNAPFLKCECGGMIFSEKMIFKKLSPIISPSGKNELLPVSVLVCEKCGKIPAELDSQDFIPGELKTKK